MLFFLALMADSLLFGQALFHPSDDAADDATATSRACRLLTAFRATTFIWLSMLLHALFRLLHFGDYLTLTQLPLAAYQPRSAFAPRFLRHRAYNGRPGLRWGAGYIHAIISRR